MRRRRTSSRIQAEIMLREYENNKRKVAGLEGEALHGNRAHPEVSIFSRGHDRDDTFRRAALLTAVEKRRMEEEIAAVEYADSLCKVLPNGIRIATIVDLVYKKGTHNMTGAAAMAGLSSEKWAGRLAARYLDFVNEYFRL
jgi:hypothetical protein